MKKAISLCSCLILLFMACKTKEFTAEQLTQQKELKTKIEQKKFVFIPLSANTMSGRNINLSSTYTFEVSGDTLKSNLPYFGRAYSAPFDPSDGGINFTSTRFQYTCSAKKDGPYRLVLKPEDLTKSHLQGLEISLEAGISGYGTLRITSNNRQPISFYGIIE